jgi:CBS domain-containing protein
MGTHKLVRDAMTSSPASINATDPIVEAARIMRDKDVGALPVLDDGRLYGMITDRDIAVRVVAEQSDPSAVTVRDVASPQVLQTTPEQDLDEALRLMAQHKVRRLAVTEGDRLVGILAQADLAQAHEAKQVGEAVGTISEPSRSDRSV